MYFFLLGYYLFRDENIGIFMSFSYLSIYIVGFFNPFISEQADFLILFVSISLFFMFISYKFNSTSMYALTLLTILLTMEIRFEVAVLFPIFLLGIFVYRFGETKKIRFWLGKLLPGLLIFILLFPVFFVHATSHHFYKTSDSILDRFLAPLPMLLGTQSSPDDEGIFLKEFVYFWTHSIPIVFAVFAFVGFVLCFSKDSRVALLISLLFIMDNMVFFVWPSGYHPRYAFATITAFIIFMGFGASFIPSLLKTRWRRVSLIGIAAFLILILSIYYGESITNLSFKKSLKFEGIESELRLFLGEITNKQANLVAIGSGCFQNIIEFLTVKKSADFMKYFLDNFFTPELLKILNEKGINYLTIGDEWRYESEPGFQTYIEKIEYTAKEAAIDSINNNETIQKSIRKIFLGNASITYFVIQNSNKDDPLIQLVKDIFNLKQVFTGKHLEIYMARV